ncbi:hypothetical protein JBE38_13815 [Pseudomonas sp. ICBG1301]|uniref:hypothetical protein n=1 Tax=Pseudomonas sp. ICBG1301 TaxID=2795987 RepID=UPI000F85C873|nr:hypothetical protein [Pseudomonas sp. ICBG1301]MBM9487003.1 hypothetical protein [Pseudomonas sp. ICBG1301]RUQ43956.1 hypothetical protein D8M30_17435 [Corynebacterium pseudodiphtheriticum]
MTTTNPLAPPQDARTAPVIVGPWPTYDHLKYLPERERWKIYSGAKAHREMLEQAGFVMSESYDDFVRRVTRELNV